MERINVGKYFDFSKGRPTSYLTKNMLSCILLAYAEMGDPSLRDIEHAILYDLRYRYIMQGYEPSYRTIQRFLEKYIKGNIHEIHKDVFLCIHDKK